MEWNISPTHRNNFHFCLIADFFRRLRWRHYRSFSAISVEQVLARYNLGKPLGQCPGVGLIKAIVALSHAPNVNIYLYCNRDLIAAVNIWKELFQKSETLPALHPTFLFGEDQRSSRRQIANQRIWFGERSACGGNLSVRRFDGASHVQAATSSPPSQQINDRPSKQSIMGDGYTLPVRIWKSQYR